MAKPVPTGKPKWEKVIDGLGDQLDTTIASAVGDQTLADLLDKNTSK